MVQYLPIAITHSLFLLSLTIDIRTSRLFKLCTALSCINIEFADILSAIVPELRTVFIQLWSDLLVFSRTINNRIPMNIRLTYNCN